MAHQCSMPVGSTALLVRRPLVAASAPPRLARSARRVVRAEDSKGKVVREFRESDGEITTPGSEQQQQSKDGTFYDDERPLPPRSNLSPAMKQRMKEEYLGLGGSTNTAMGANWFLYISVGIGALALLSWITGAI